VDLCTAKLLKPLVCDGIIAPAYEPEALALLRGKKKGAFIVLQAEADFQPPVEEFRELYGVAFSQRRNDRVFTEDLLNNVVVVGSGLQEGTTTPRKLLSWYMARSTLLLTEAVLNTKARASA
jgi:phosphoribosylaminoimidazolecarboxamide formyltransferase/IMP cyclohydrolase